jgi:oligopeptide/dipeptide ABC transporter ATP-binding protein
MTPPAEPILSAERVSVTFSLRGRPLPALDDVSVHIAPGRTLAVVGESGSGKSTLARVLMRAQDIRHGRVVFDGADVTTLGDRALRPFRRRVQMVFQDPYASLDPRMTVERIVGEPLRAQRLASGARLRERVGELLGMVGLPPDAAARRPAQFSGGQRQRIAIARALAPAPDVLIADEPVSALDVSIQAQIVNLLQDVQRARHLAMMVISHDLALVHHLADHVVVMYLGRVVESAPCDDMIGDPQHPYTAALLSATPTLDGGGDRERIVLREGPPSPLNRPTGCAFHTRCPIAQPRCAAEAPQLAAAGAGRSVACFYPGKLAGRVRADLTIQEEVT